jgi:protein tyrosine phosphatase
LFNRCSDRLRCSGAAVPVQITPTEAEIKQPIRGEARLQCNATGYPRLSVEWLRVLSPTLDSSSRASNTSSDASATLQYEPLPDPLPPGFEIQNQAVTDHELHSKLYIRPLLPEHAGRYVCRARNAYANHSESILSLRVLELPTLGPLSLDRVDAHIIRVRMRLVNDLDAPLQTVVIKLRSVSANLSATGSVDSSNNSVNSLTSSIQFANSSTNLTQTNLSQSTVIERRVRLTSDSAGNLVQAVLILPLADSSSNVTSVGAIQNDSIVVSVQSKANRSDENVLRLESNGDLLVMVDKLQPANTYQVQVYVENLVGRAGPFNTSLVTTAPDVPSRVRDIHMLAKTNETLLFGWKRPLFDNGSPINRYEVQLAADRPDNWLRNETKDVELNGTPVRNNYMYMFVNLRPGSLYFFRVRGCSDVGCSEWSEPPLSGITQDGLADPPDDIQVRCYSELVELTIDKTNASLAKLSSADPKNVALNANPILPDSNKTSDLSKSSSIHDSSLVTSAISNSSSDVLLDSPSFEESPNISSTASISEIKTVKEWQHFVHISWLASSESRGTLLGFNITLEGWAKYVNEHNQEVVDSQRQQFEFRLPDSFQLEQRLEMTLRVRPNTRYQIRMCSLNKAGCGVPSVLTTSARCDSAQSVQTMRFSRLSRLIEVPTPVPSSSSATSSSPSSSSPSSSSSSNIESNDASGRLWLATNRVSERDGKIKCYRIVMIPLPNIYKNKFTPIAPNSIKDKVENQMIISFNRSAMPILPSDPMRILLTSYERTHEKLAKISGRIRRQFSDLNKNASDSITADESLQNARAVVAKDNLVGYVAKELTSRTLYSPIVIGDNSTSSCDTLHESSLGATEDEPNVSGAANGEPFQPNAIVSPAAALTLPQSDQSGGIIESSQSFANQANNDLEPVATRLSAHNAFNGRLEGNTEYTGFVEIHVFGPNGSVLVQRSAYFEPARTPIEFPAISRDRLSSTRLFERLFDQNHSKLLAISTAGFLLLLFVLVLFVIMFLRRKVDRHHSTHSSNGTSGKSVQVSEKKYNSTVNSYGYDQNSFTSLDQKGFPSWGNGKNSKDAVSSYSIYGTLSKKSLENKSKERMLDQSIGSSSHSQLITFNRPQMSNALTMTDPRLLAVLQYTPTAVHLKAHAANTLGQQSWVGQPIPVQQLVEVFRLRHQDDDALFRVEFDMLPYEFSDRTSLCCELPENRIKSRYPDLKLFDQTRVQLTSNLDAIKVEEHRTIDDGTGFPSPPPSPPPAFHSSHSRQSVDSECSLQRQIAELNTCSSKALNQQHLQSIGFVNANLVRLSKAYICAQGPLPHTLSDFWQMILEQNVQVIVMLTGVQEQSKEKCAPYWDESGALLSINSHISVQLVASRYYCDHVLRRIKLITSSGSERILLHFQFTIWKDFLAPDQPSWLLR